MKGLGWPILFGLLPAPAGAQSLELLGQAGQLGEWELAATVTEQAEGAKEFSGPWP